MKLFAPFQIDLDNQNLVRAQHASFSKQVPLLYFILCVNSISVAFTHYGVVPWFLSVPVPVCLALLCVARAASWWRLRNVTVSDATAVTRLKAAIVFGGVVGSAVVCWALLLYIYGNTSTRGHLNLAVAVTGIGCLFSLMHLRAAALVLAGAVLVPYTTFLLLTQEAISVTIGVNLILVTGAMLYILLVVSNDFERMVENQEQAERLGGENLTLANVDSLTGLPNRRKFFSNLDDLLERASRDQGPRFAVGLIDLDGFKSVNDLYGHTAGDRLLSEVSERLRTFVRPGVSIARLGGDEFGLLVTDVNDDADLVRLGDRICAALRVPFAGFGSTVHLSGSTGFARFPDAGRTRELLFERADYAMYHGKQTLRGHPVIFDPSHEARIRNNSVTERCLRNADLEAELSLRFQPLFDVNSSRPVAFEALARWSSPELGNVPPNVFIGVAERTDLITRITPTLLRKTLAAARTWPRDIRVSFNLSIRDLLTPESILHIISIVRASGVAADRIDFEVTETAFMGDFDRARESIRALKAIGARIALDDFGTGYSSLSYVHRLPLDKIKVDRSFVAGIEEQGTCQTIVKTVVDLCRSLQIECVVEGAETAAQVEILRSLGCEAMQGYFFGKPMPEAEVIDFIAASHEAAVPDAADCAA